MDYKLIGEEEVVAGKCLLIRHGGEVVTVS